MDEEQPVKPWIISTKHKRNYNQTSKLLAIVVSCFEFQQHSQIRYPSERRKHDHEIPVMSQLRTGGVLDFHKEIGKWLIATLNRHYPLKKKKTTHSKINKTYQSFWKTSEIRMLLWYVFKPTAQLMKGSHRWRLMRVLTSINSLRQ